MKTASHVQAFLSHARADKKIVRRLGKDLIQHGIDIWLDEEKISPGQSIPFEIQKGLETSDFLLIFLTPSAVDSGWVRQEWESKFFEQVNCGKISVIPLLLESCTIPPFLQHIKYADFTSDYEDGLSQLLQSLSNLEVEDIYESSNMFDTVADLLDRFANENVTIPFAGKLPIIHGLKRLPRSGKHLRIGDMRLADGRKVPSRSLYDHVLSVAHTADCLYNIIDHKIDEKDTIDLARCIAFHELNEVLLGDIPAHTKLSQVRRHRSRIEAEQRLRNVQRRERERIANEFIWLFLETPQKRSFGYYLDIVASKDSNLYYFFRLLDKIDPIIGIWRYIHTFRGRFRDGPDDFLKRMHDFFENPDPRSMAKKYTNDHRMLDLVSYLQNKQRARAYYDNKDMLFEKPDLFGVPPTALKAIIEGKKMLFVEPRHVVGFKKR